MRTARRLSPGAFVRTGIPGTRCSIVAANYVWCPRNFPELPELLKAIARGLRPHGYSRDMMLNCCRELCVVSPELRRELCVVSPELRNFYDAQLLPRIMCGVPGTSAMREIRTLGSVGTRGGQPPWVTRPGTSRGLRPHGYSRDMMLNCCRELCVVSPELRNFYDAQLLPRIMCGVPGTSTWHRGAWLIQSH